MTVNDKKGTGKVTPGIIADQVCSSAGIAALALCPTDVRKWAVLQVTAHNRHNHLWDPRSKKQPPRPLIVLRDPEARTLYPGKVAGFRAYFFSETRRRVVYQSIRKDPGRYLKFHTDGNTCRFRAPTKEPTDVPTVWTNVDDVTITRGIVLLHVYFEGGIMERHAFLLPEKYAVPWEIKFA